MKIGQAGCLAHTLWSRYSLISNKTDVSPVRKGFYENIVVRFGRSYIVDLDMEGREKIIKGGANQLVRLPNIISQKASEAGEGFSEGCKGLYHGWSMNFFAQLDKVDDEGGKEFERGAWKGFTKPG